MKKQKLGFLNHQIIIIEKKKLRVFHFKEISVSVFASHLV